MYDSFYFEKGVLSDNKEEPSVEFQTKSLNCGLDEYYVDKTGNILVSFFEKKPEKEQANFTETIIVYSYVWEGSGIITKDTKCRSQKYELEVFRGRVIAHKKIEEEGYDAL